MATRRSRIEVTMSRRRFLGSTVGIIGAGALTGPLAFLHTKKAEASPGTLAPSPYGPLAPAPDRATGLELIMLPPGFSYTTFSWAGDLMRDGNLVPPRHDGMAVVQADTPGRGAGEPGNGGRRRGPGRLREAYLIRNHEEFTDGRAKSPIAQACNYDEAGGGGTTVLVFRHRRFVDHWVSLSGTIANCAGGRTPWGSWLTCEEEVPGDAGEVDFLDRPHGFVYESTIERVANPQPLTVMGRFKHEALAFDPRTGIVYETEDNSARDGTGNDRNRGQSLFYRCVPARPLGGVGSLRSGGRLEALRAISPRGPVDDLRQPNFGETFRVQWVPVAEPSMPPGANGTSGPFRQGRAQGATRFQRLEGCWWDPVNANVVFVDTEGGPAFLRPDRGEGAVWVYNPADHTLTNVFVARVPGVVDNSDNVSVSPRGGVMLCEDGGRDIDGNGLSLLGLLRDGRVFEFARNTIMLNRRQVRKAGKNVEAILGNAHEVDFSGQEWAGAAFDPTGHCLFVNIQTPGITFAITGPWRRGIF